MTEAAMHQEKGYEPPGTGERVLLAALILVGFVLVALAKPLLGVPMVLFALLGLGVANLKGRSKLRWFTVGLWLGPVVLASLFFRRVA